MALNDDPIQFTKEEKHALLRLLIMGMYRCMELKRDPPREVSAIMKKLLGREIGIRLEGPREEDDINT